MRRGWGSTGGPTGQGRVPGALDGERCHKFRKRRRKGVTKARTHFWSYLASICISEAEVWIYDRADCPPRLFIDQEPTTGTKSWLDIRLISALVRGRCGGRGGVAAGGVQRNANTEGLVEGGFCWSRKVRGASGALWGTVGGLRHFLFLFFIWGAPALRRGGWARTYREIKNARPGSSGRFSGVRRGCAGRFDGGTASHFCHHEVNLTGAGGRRLNSTGGG